jgi:P-type Ca2+ transporter type 2C
MTVTTAYTVDHGLFDVHHAPPILSADDSRSKLFLVGNLCNHTHAERNGKTVGQATEVALMNVLQAVGLRDERKVS